MTVLRLEKVGKQLQRHGNDQPGRLRELVSRAGSAGQAGETFWAVRSVTLEVRPGEADSFYHHKFPHGTHSAISPTQPHALPPRIEAEILKKFSWFFKQFYPEVELAGGDKDKN